MHFPSVSLPAATSIEGSAFYECTSLTSVSLPSATSIGDGAFYDCSLLTSVSLPAATSIGNGVFLSCTSLTSVYFGTSKPTEGSDVFYSEGAPINATIYYPTGASAWSNVTTFGGMPTAPYTSSPLTRRLNMFAKYINEYQIDSKHPGFRHHRRKALWQHQREA